MITQDFNADLLSVVGEVAVPQISLSDAVDTGLAALSSATSIMCC